MGVYACGIGFSRARFLGGVDGRRVIEGLIFWFGWGFFLLLG